MTMTMTMSSTQRIVALLLMACMSMPARADVISPEVQSLGTRLQFSRAVDRVDQYCAGKGIDAACLLPGNAFEGGGPGICRREGNLAQRKIDLTCTLSSPLVIDRQLPEDAEFIAAESFCGMQGDEQVDRLLANTDITCIQPEVLPADRFCRNKGSGDACVAEGKLDGEIQSFPGRCGVTGDSTRFYQYGYNDAERRFVACLPANPLPPRVYEPVGFFRNLLTW